MIKLYPTTLAGIALIIMMMLKYILPAVLLALIAYIYRLNAAMSRKQPRMYALSPHRFTVEEIKETYARIEREDTAGHGQDHLKQALPRRLDRRYIITGGAGLLGIDIMQTLLMQGHPIESIRCLDLRKPSGEGIDDTPIAKIHFIKTDISNRESVKAAFAIPWDSSVANLPLTVIHTAASIWIADRSRATYNRIKHVNVNGTCHLLESAKVTPHCDTFIGVASGSIAIKPANLWAWSIFSRLEIPNWTQILNESDADKPLREHEEYFSNYAVSKAEAERLILGANDEEGGFRTGVVRPTNGIYGNGRDHTLAAYVRSEAVPTFAAQIIQAWVSVTTVTLSVLQLEIALNAPTYTSLFQGQTFVISDPNPALAFSDIFLVLSTSLITPFRTTQVPPGLLVVLSYLIYWYQETLKTWPILQRTGLKLLEGDIAQLSPAIFSITNYHFADDRKARRPMSEGGLDMGRFQGGKEEGEFSSLSMMCRQVLMHNKACLARGVVDKRRGDDVQKPIREEANGFTKGLGAMAADR